MNECAYSGIWSCQWILIQAEGTTGTYKMGVPGGILYRVSSELRGEAMVFVPGLETVVEIAAHSTRDKGVAEAEAVIRRYRSALQEIAEGVAGAAKEIAGSALKCLVSKKRERKRNHEKTQAP